MSHKKDIASQKVLYVIHITLYLLAALLLAHLLLVEKGILRYYLATATLVLFIALLVIELIVNPFISKIKEKRYVVFILLKVLQLLSAYLFYFAFHRDYKYGLDVAFFILFSMELLYAIDFEEILYRILGYLGIGIPFITMIAIYVIQNDDLKFEAKFREFVAGAVILTIVIFTGEMLALIWKYFGDNILKQYRTLDRLNETNDELKKHQEKVNRVNELLGLQKVQLQAANKKINAAHEEMMVQNAIANVISSSLDLKQLICSLSELIKRKMKVDFISIVAETNAQRRANENAATHYAVYLSTLSEEHDKMLLGAFRTRKFSEILEMDTTYVENSSKTGQLFDLESLHFMNSIIVLPLVNNGAKVGNMIVGSLNEYEFSGNREFYETIAGQISMGVTNAILYQKMKEMAIRDGLTGIYNRRYLTEEVNRYVTEARETGKSVSLALFDIDKFKMINDTYGHLFGDDVIRHVAKILNYKALDNNGLAGRYGGEEFVLAFPGKTLQETYRLIKEVHEEIRATTVSHEGKEVQVRVSAGISSYPETCSNPNEILTRADWAMYHSKRNGRDQITIDSESVSAKM